MNRVSKISIPDANLAGTEEFAERVSQYVRATVDTGKYRPPLLPHVAIRLNTIASKLDVEISEVENTVIRDPSIAARIVSVANSALYSRGTPITSLRASIMRIGIPMVRDVAFQVVTTSKLFRVPGYTERMTSIFGTAHAAGLIARQVNVIRSADTDMAYLCGLLHDLGEAVILSIVAEAFSGKAPLPALHDLQLGIKRHHAFVGSYVCDKWRLNDAVVDAVLHHHDPSRSGHKEKMAHVLGVTDLLLAHAGIGMDWQPITKAAEYRFAELGIGPEKLPNLLRFAESLGAPPISVENITGGG